MSWAGYLDNLTCGNHVTKAAIFGLDGNPWTPGDHPKALKMSPSEVQSVVQALDNPANAQTNGVYVNGERYRFLRCDKDCKTAQIKLKEVGTCCFAQTNTAVVAGFCPEGQSAGCARDSVEKIQEYLKGQNV